MSHCILLVVLVKKIPALLGILIGSDIHTFFIYNSVLLGLDLIILADSLMFFHTKKIWDNNYDSIRTGLGAPFNNIFLTFALYRTTSLTPLAQRESFSWCGYINVISPKSIFQNRSCELNKNVVFRLVKPLSALFK